MVMHKIKTVFFDLDGTLLDTAPDLTFALNKLLEQKGQSAVAIEQVRRIASHGCRGMLNLALQIDEDHPEYEMSKELFLNFYQQHLCVNTALFAGMDVVLAKLESHGINWGVVTNKSTALAGQLLSYLDLASRCVCIVGRDCVTKPKPHSEPLLLACQLSGCVPSECVYIGDAEGDIVAAKEAGMRSIAALYGYLNTDCSPETWHADYYIDQPKDILGWLDRQLSYI
jgi:phosphoglycolate phosphatase